MFGALATPIASFIGIGLAVATGFPFAPVPVAMCYATYMGPRAETARVGALQQA